MQESMDYDKCMEKVQTSSVLRLFTMLKAYAACPPYVFHKLCTCQKLGEIVNEAKHSPLHMENLNVERIWVGQE